MAPHYFKGTYDGGHASPITSKGWGRHTMTDSGTSLPRLLSMDVVFPHMCAGPPLPPSISISFICSTFKQCRKFKSGS